MNSCSLASSIGEQDIFNDASDEMLVTAAKLIVFLWMSNPMKCILVTRSLLGCL